MAKHVVAALSDVPPGSRKLVEVAGRPVAIFNIRGEVFALLNRCPHQGASLCHGHLSGFPVSHEPGVVTMDREGEILRCPWHGWEFDVRTGQSWFDPDHTKVKMYPASISKGMQIVEGPYKAETFPVSIESDYVCIDM